MKRKGPEHAFIAMCMCGCIRAFHLANAGKCSDCERRSRINGCKQFEYDKERAIA